MSKRGDRGGERREPERLFGGMGAAGGFAVRRRLRLRGLADFERIDADRLGDVLELRSGRDR